jgi:hypothetical protein
MSVARLRTLAGRETGPLSRYAHAIVAHREDQNISTLMVRAEDMHSLAIMYNEPVTELVDRLISWGVVPTTTRETIRQTR